MFATGSHDGAVRIWTIASTPALSRDGRAKSGSVTPLGETSSQLHLDLEPRTESSAGQQQFGQLLHVETPFLVPDLCLLTTTAELIAARMRQLQKRPGDGD
jgi:hypothetical protein